MVGSQPVVLVQPGIDVHFLLRMYAGCQEQQQYCNEFSQFRLVLNRIKIQLLPGSGTLIFKITSLCGGGWVMACAAGFFHLLMWLPRKPASRNFVF